ncbi:MAG: DEAD/DEAH box helicase [Pirellulaceae bacterium]|nr:DEAD/DEAH box helicase [Pirellulaceae bacterium]
MSNHQNVGAPDVKQTVRDDIAEQYFAQLPFEPYPVQEDALFAWFSSAQGVLVCAPTGTGKTLIAEAAIFEALHLGRKAYYTTPLIALTDQKYRELKETVMRWGYSPDIVGLVTGNRKINPDAPIQVVVAEILLNRLLDPSQGDWSDVWAVVMDEFHSFNDPERGIVWEFGLGLLPAKVRTLLLSATVGNSPEFVNWLRFRHARSLTLVEGKERKVPLTFQWVEDQTLPEQLELMFDGDESLRLTPALVFCFNREQCWTVAELFKGKALVTSDQQQQLNLELQRFDWTQGAGPKLKQILQRGIGVHHAGVLPRYRRIVEDLFQKKLLSVAACTETLAAGINLPARSVVLPTLMKGPFNKKTLVEPSSAHQMFGRAGRPQFDDRGFVIALAHEDDVKYNRWKVKYDQIPVDTKDPGLMRAKKQLKKKMPRRREGFTYWTQKQFEQLQAAKPASLESRGPIPWQLLAYMLNLNTDVDLLRQLIGKRLIPLHQLEYQSLELNRRLVALWRGRFIELDPLPPFERDDLAAVTLGQALASNDRTNAKTPGDGFGAGLFDDEDEAEPPADDATPLVPGEHTARKTVSNGVFDVAIKPAAALAKNDSVVTDTGPLAASASAKSARQKLLDYKPQHAHPTTRLDDFIRLRAIHPVFGIYLIDHLAKADDNERILAVESLLEMPPSVGSATRVPNPDELPLGPLALEVLHPQLLRLGLVTTEELFGRQEEDDGPRQWTEEPPPRIVSLPHKIQRLFQYDNPGIDDVKIQPVWVIGRLREFNWNFNNYITSYKLQKQEGMIFRHVLRGILLFEEVAEVGPRDGDYYEWSDFWYALADEMIECCRLVDSIGTEEILAETRERGKR